MNQSAMDSTPETDSESLPLREPLMVTRFITESRFFSAAFNAAIFDGPVRIYFAQYQEAQALKLYFTMQEHLGEIRKEARGLFRNRKRNIFVMIYPSDETFEQSFGKPTSLVQMGAGAEVATPQIVRDRLGVDFIIGVCGPLEEDTLKMVCQDIGRIIDTPQE